ncbi:MAG: hypothetical protein H6Q17_2746 [Bacteroidetes bacterium]|nr:hypothetical protein [Bacteroidota bacterium]
MNDLYNNAKTIHLFNINYLIKEANILFQQQKTTNYIQAIYLYIKPN